jgi:hypothetical protein
LVHNWEDDRRAFSEVLCDWTRRHSGDAANPRQRAAELLRVSETNIAAWEAGKPCGYERLIRRMMMLIDRVNT